MRFKLGLSYIHSYFSGDDVNLTGSTVVARGALRRVATTGNSYGVQASFSQPWPDSFGWAGYTNAILENGAH